MFLLLDLEIEIRASLASGIGCYNNTEFKTPEIRVYTRRRDPTNAEGGQIQLDVVRHALTPAGLG